MIQSSEKLCIKNTVLNKMNYQETYIFLFDLEFGRSLDE
jgi:hypothetical protein